MRLAKGLSSRACGDAPELKTTKDVHTLRNHETVIVTGVDALLHQCHRWSLSSPSV
jgi:hypothetical protein